MDYETKKNDFLKRKEKEEEEVIKEFKVKMVNTSFTSLKSIYFYINYSILYNSFDYYSKIFSDILKENGYSNPCVEYYSNSYGNIVSIKFD